MVGESKRLPRNTHTFLQAIFCSHLTAEILHVLCHHARGAASSPPCQGHAHSSHEGGHHTWFVSPSHHLHRLSWRGSGSAPPFGHAGFSFNERVNSGERVQMIYICQKYRENEQTVTRHGRCWRRGQVLSANLTKCRKLGWFCTVLVLVPVLWNETLRD